MRTRKAILPDADQIHDIIGIFSQAGALLPRSRAELCENVRDFIVAEDAGRIIGCAALHLYGPHLAEIRSIAVIPGSQGSGSGRRLVKSLLAEAARQQVGCVCLFTRIPNFFARLGFAVVQHHELPDKIYKDCLNCPQLHACDEIAMYRGQLPKIAILQPSSVDVQLKQINAPSP